MERGAGGIQGRNENRRNARLGTGPAATRRPASTSTAPTTATSTWPRAAAPAPWTIPWSRRSTSTTAPAAAPRSRQLPAQHGEVDQRRLLAAQRRALLRQGHLRSEEHTSELQSLMRISYAVFCLKKKTNQTHKQTQYK